MNTQNNAQSNSHSLDNHIEYEANVLKRYEKQVERFASMPIIDLYFTYQFMTGRSAYIPDRIEKVWMFLEGEQGIEGLTQALVHYVQTRDLKTEEDYEFACRIQMSFQTECDYLPELMINLANSLLARKP